MYNSNMPLGYIPQPKFHNTNKNGKVNLIDIFEEGVALDKLRKIELRKDAMMLLRVKQKYDIISKHFSKFHSKTNRKIPIIKLENGENLLLKSPESMYQYREIYEIFLEELHNCNIAFFGLLPNLMKLSIRFSNISLLTENEFCEEERYTMLKELNLNCNNLDSSSLEIIRHINNLKKLNLMGNFITAEIPDIYNLIYLEELDLSFNHIESYYVNLNMLKDYKDNNFNLKLPKIPGTIKPKILNEDEKNNNGNDYNDKETNENHLIDNQKKFEQLQQYLKTNMQDFFHKISLLKNLKKLNLSHNRINFFDIDPIFIQENSGFKNLETLDLSHNLIEDEIAILMVINLPVIKNIDITNNPLTYKKLEYEDIEYEIFKCKNILLTNNQEFKKLKSKYNVNDIMNYPPKPYIVKKIKLEQKSKKELTVKVKEEIPLIDYREEDKNDNNNENNDEDNTNISNVELPPLFTPSINPILLTRLDLIGKSKKNK